MVRVSPSHPYNAGRAGLGWGGCNAGRSGLVYNSPKYRGDLDRIPFQGFARRSGIQVFRLYSRPSPVTDRNGDL